LESALGQVCARLGRWSEAIDHLHAGLELVADPLERARLRGELTAAFVANRQGGPGLREAELGLRDLGVTPPGDGALDYITSIAVASRVADRFARARTAVVQGWVANVSGDPRGGERISRAALEAHGRWLDAQAYVVACRDLTWNLLMRGYCAEALGWTQRAIGRHEASSGQASDLAADAGALLAVLGRR